MEKESPRPEGDFRVALIDEMIRARNEKGLTQKQLEAISGVKQPVIARLEAGRTSPNVDTVIRLLLALGKKLSVVSIDEVS